jgi:hypothetical protein
MGIVLGHLSHSTADSRFKYRFDGNGAIDRLAIRLVDLRLCNQESDFVISGQTASKTRKMMIATR